MYSIDTGVSDMSAAAANGKLFVLVTYVNDEEPEPGVKIGQVRVFSTVSGALLSSFTPSYNLTVSSYSFIAVSSDSSTMYILAVVEETFPTIFTCSVLNPTQVCTFNFLEFNVSLNYLGLTVVTNNTIAILSETYNPNDDEFYNDNDYQIDTYLL